jgi:hypothetical protein
MSGRPRCTAGQRGGAVIALRLSDQEIYSDLIPTGERT